MELTHLRTFIAVAAERNLSRAAERLHLSPSAVSGHISALESELDLTLFERTSKGMDLTPAGERLLEQAQAVISASEEMLNTARALQAEISGAVHIGLNSDPAFLRVSGLTRQMGDTYPAIALAYTSTATGHIIAAMLAGRMDAGFIYGSPPDKSLDAFRLTTADLVVAGHTDFSEEMNDASWSQLAELPWVVEDIYCPFQALTETMFRGRDYRRAATSSDDRTKYELVVGGVGLAIMARHEAEDLIEEGASITYIEPEPLACDLCFVTPAHRSADPLIRALRGVVEGVWNQ